MKRNGKNGKWQQRGGKCDGKVLKDDCEGTILLFFLIFLFFLCRSKFQNMNLISLLINNIKIPKN